MTVLVGYLPTPEGNAAFSAALERAAAAGYTHLNLDGTVIRTDRVAAVGTNDADLGGPENTTEGTCR
jgi:hypothetical protein